MHMLFAVQDRAALEQMRADFESQLHTARSELAKAQVGVVEAATASQAAKAHICPLLVDSRRPDSPLLLFAGHPCLRFRPLLALLRHGCSYHSGMLTRLC